ncbi:hypothetical protein [Actinoplanes sp. NPDC020271]|uniref:hypothetical protein n=1 Tax=Actinoplanes sp. NPDC020271 TaxID=3363896 RepID=UPI0037A7A909
MISEIELAPAPGGHGRVQETVGLLQLLKTRLDDDWQLVLEDLPGWLVDAFAPERTDEESNQWRARWLASDDPVAFMNESGWTASGWLYWFSSENEFWTLKDVRLDDDGRGLTMLVEHEDSPFPSEAVRWLAFVAGLEAGEEKRIS